MQPDHSRSVARLALKLGRWWGLSDPELNRLAQGAALHDLGKEDLPPGLLAKPGPLNEQEAALMRTHPARGAARLLRRGTDPEVARVVLCHHESVDGRGYPAGRDRSDIPMLARMTSLADAFDALVAERAYKPSLSVREALGVIRAERGRRFDRRLADLLLSRAPLLFTNS
jgi:putative nucleotidyltransferase with HDIG domain